MPDNITLFAKTNYRNELKKFGIRTDDRRRHMYLIGKTGMGKSTVLENMIIDDIRAGYGVAVVDPHGDLAEKIIEYIPTNRIKDVIYFNPADINYPIVGKGSHIYDFVESGKSNWEKLSYDGVGANEKLVYKKI
jgi:DNA helicase HerA-like ATPase